METRKYTSEDIITLSVIQKALENIAEEMGIVLRRASFSPNCKERLDFSCAIFNKNAELVAQAEHIPVHIGAMFSAISSILDEFPLETIKPGDIIILNSPYYGGTHLPDITFLMPVFIDEQLAFFVNNRAHHADIGGSVPGSMPGISSELYEEGLIIPPIKLYNEGKEVTDVMNLILSNVRVKTERLGDFRAQRAALLRGEERLRELSQKYGLDFLLDAVNKLMNISEKSFQEELNKIPDGTYQYEDFLDSNGITSDLVKICVKITKTFNKILISFNGTDPVQEGNVNAPHSVVYSCVYFVFRALTDSSIMTNAGLFRNIEIEIPENSMLNPQNPSAVSSGNVETSQRLVDVILGALAQSLNQIPAASQGTMNNVTIGSKKAKNAFTYYETIGGGAGASGVKNGTSAIHSHMTNTLNTPIEALELTYPLRVKEYSIRKNSGGEGRYKGGNGIIRAIECLVDSIVSLQSERRTKPPYGLHGGKPGKTGENFKINIKGEVQKLPGRATVEFYAGETLVVKTPGGGGYKLSENSAD
ncbi:MAG: hydantoinase B/oxoprolinase family protein [Candidatus Heimdallarchaeota archaeon]|nr:hydantoinase B/oxoprolinase family protein [Candidatus Heimdallarchaeota archaeon]